MKILHAAFCGDSLCLWGETDAIIPPRRKAAGKKKNALRDLPQCMPFSELKELSWLSGWSSREVETANLAGWLPGANGVAVPSSLLMGEMPAETAEIKIEPWSIQALRLNSIQACSLLQVNQTVPRHNSVAALRCGS